MNKLTKVQFARPINRDAMPCHVFAHIVPFRRRARTQFADATLHFLREKVPRCWADLRNSITDNFGFMSPKDFRVVA
jgi:hypothetical protein